MSNSKEPNGPGFFLGLALGALMGTGTALLAGTKKGRETGQKFISEVGEKIDQIKENHPKQVSQIEDILEQALNEARSAADEIKQVAGDATKKAKKETEKRLFVQSGKPLKKISQRQ